MAEDLNTIFADAKTKADNASNIAFQWANGDENTVIETESGLLSSLAKFQFDNVGAGSFSEFIIDLSAGDVTISGQQLLDNAYFVATGNSVARTVNIPATPKIFYIENRGSSPVTLVRDVIEFVLPSNATFIIYTDGDIQGMYNITSQVVKKTKTNAAPTVTDDISQGYSVYSEWIDTTNAVHEVYRCTDSSVGAAQWVKVSLGTDELGTASAVNVGSADNEISLNLEQRTFAEESAIVFSIALG